jgi:hypothetical protein
MTCATQTPSNMSLEKEFRYYLANQDALVKQYRGKFIVIKDCQVIGAYADEIEAIQKTSAIHPLGTFLVQECEPGTEYHTETFHSRVTFA